MIGKCKIIKQPGAEPKPHEMWTAEFLMRYFETDIEFIKETKRHGIHTPDIKMFGLRWEIKAPVGNAKNTIINKTERCLQFVKQ